MCCILMHFVDKMWFASFYFMCKNIVNVQVGMGDQAQLRLILYTELSPVL